MLRFVIRRLLSTVPMVLVVVSLTWGLIRLAPGSFYTGEKALPAAVEQNIRAKYGLDKPWYIQYGKMISNTLRGDFGTSLKYEGQSVNSILLRAFPVSALVGLMAYTLSLLVGITSGLIAAVRHNSKWDYTSMTFSMLGISVPTFVLGPILVLIFSLSLYWFPPARWDGFATRSAVLPVLTLSIIYMAYIARLTRSGMLEVLRSDYIRTARAKGLTEKAVVLKHAFRGGIIPVVSLTGPALAGLITGTVVVERIFVLPGLGTYFINANLNRDEPLILGIVAFISITVLIANLLVDIAYAWIDPEDPLLSSPSSNEVIAGSSLLRQAMRRLVRNRLAVFGMIVVGVIALAAIVGPWLIFRATGYTYDYIPADSDLVQSFAPSRLHPMGTDNEGRDMLARVLLGGRISLMVGVISTLVSLLIGTAYGATAGYAGGKVDEVMMRIVDILFAIPYMMIVIVLLALFGKHTALGQLVLLFVALGAVSWLTMARIVRGQVISLKNQEFIMAARATGVSRWKIVARHLVPNTLGPVIVYATLEVPAVMLLEAFLSFLGLGVQAPLASWGSLASEGIQNIAVFPWQLIFPGLTMALTLFSLNFVGDGLRDALDPQTRRS